MLKTKITNFVIFQHQCRVLLNLRTSQPFEEVVEDLGQVLKINGAKRMYTVSGQEVCEQDFFLMLIFDTIQNVEHSVSLSAGSTLKGNLMGGR